MLRSRSVRARRDRSRRATSPYDALGRRRSPVTMPEYRLGGPAPNKGMKLPAEPLTRREVAALLAAVGARGPAAMRNRALIVVLWRCGLRVSEALALFPKDVDLEAGVVRVLHGKGDRDRVVAIDAQAGEVLRAWLERRRALGLAGRHPLFCTIARDGGPAGRPVRSAYVRNMLKRVGARAGIEKRVHPHGLRHTFASELAEEGRSLQVIQAALGHASAATTDRYIRRIAPHQLVRELRGREWQEVSHGDGGASAG